MFGFLPPKALLRLGRLRLLRPLSTMSPPTFVVAADVAVTASFGSDAGIDLSVLTLDLSSPTLVATDPATRRDRSRPPRRSSGVS